MNRFLYISVIVFALFTSCESNLPVSDRVISKDNNLNAKIYPSEVNRLGIQQLYDKTKWYLYCIQSNGVLLFRDKTIQDDTTTYGTLPLVFDHIEMKSDTIEIDFGFYYHGIEVDGRLVDPAPTWGAVFVGRSDSIILFSSRDEFRYFMFTCDSQNVPCPYRTVNPLQPEVIDYIRKNRDKLDPWFRKEAIKRGVISE